ncbi:branched-chain amino acid ABC transporter permease [Xanthobacter tagetidis]|uniref:Branched-chain amino acid ABC transporter permease n=1 Tax=Xanthobacter tagetidis TaxID=60216 RepID=A0A3L7AIB3_9HYPH|nr:branched-chain amino acid ABC transporter permease [Xanthobacter tagetidis]MBB6306466.1 branched-chain amino acid transport system permease protein [Xanthobacter tagetidis]RLP79715.1 branched-chain amino acid ABC transporter permease [Xanthobacter tagetidis]
MFYRDSGLIKTTYKADRAIFPVDQDRWAIVALVGLAFLVPAVASEYWLSSILIPFFIFSVAAIGLNILVGYAGLLSLGTGGFMAVGAFAAYNFAIRIPELNIIVVLILAGLVSAGVGIIFGLPSLRIKGFYLAVATLASQFFIEWLFVRVPWFTNYSTSGVISAPAVQIFGYDMSGAAQRYLIVLAMTVAVAVTAKNMVRSAIGRSWMAIRDMDVAAEIIGVRPLRTKLVAFAVSSFYCGLAGAMWVFFYIGTVEPQAFDLNRSFQILFMVIIGGLGTIVGCFFGAAFVILLPILLDNLFALLGTGGHADLLSHAQMAIYGALIIILLIKEPHGMAKMWQIFRQRMRIWPFPY